MINHGHRPTADSHSIRGGLRWVGGCSCNWKCVTVRPSRAEALKDAMDHVRWILDKFNRLGDNP